jgi:hypothetical protein
MDKLTKSKSIYDKNKTKQDKISGGDPKWWLG